MHNINWKACGVLTILDSKDMKGTISWKFMVYPTQILIDLGI